MSFYAHTKCADAVSLPFVANDPINGVDPTGAQSVPGTFFIETACNGNSACVQRYREGQKVVGGAIVDFLVGDITTAISDPSFKNIAIAVMGVTPVGKPIWRQAFRLRENN